MVVMTSWTFSGSFIESFTTSSRNNGLRALVLAEEVNLIASDSSPGYKINSYRMRNIHLKVGRPEPCGDPFVRFRALIYLPLSQTISTV